MGVVKGVAFVDVKITLNNEFLVNKNLENSSYRFEKLARWKTNSIPWMWLIPLPSLGSWYIEI